ncbi:hemolysin family protein [Pseudoflavonifractor phocaeensis]|uniref:hemolysin family protein n=1 Tax=Pseudoflavonifractor phocaeensis TaxID=1870988 RepID=UPI001FAFC9D9|nr:hemolysin family protein [Pseudoflavonifractor phocaeensis]
MDEPLWPQLLLQAILIALNAFFASSEIALLSLNEGMLRLQAEEGDKTAGRLLAIVEAPTRFLSTIQIGITLAGFLGSAFAAENFAGRLTAAAVDLWALNDAAAGVVNTLSVVVVTVILSFFTLVFGELVPKRVAMQKAEAVARFTAGVIRVLSVVMRPVIWLLTVSTNGMLRLLGLDPDGDEEEVSEEGIRMMMDLGEEQGAIQSDEKAIIENVFDFNDLTAEEVMVHRTDMVTLSMEDSDETILDTIKTSGLSRFPVCGEDVDDILGILSTRTYLLNRSSPAPKPLKALLRKPYFVPGSVEAHKLFRDLQAKKVHMAIVVDEYGGTAGLLTLEDLLEEIVGNIYDEFDPQERPEIIPLGEGRWRVSGGAPLDEVAEALGVTFPEEEEAETLGGLVFEQFSVLPEDGSHPEVEIYGLTIRVELLRERRVEWALLSFSESPTFFRERK